MIDDSSLQQPGTPIGAASTMAAAAVVTIDVAAPLVDVNLQVVEAENEESVDESVDLSDGED